MKIPENILKILAECRIENNTLFLPPEQLDRKTYQAVNKCLENIGGKWNRKAKGHVFDDDPTDAFDSLLITGETEDMKKKFQFFPTPRPVAEMMCDLAELKTAKNVLEPSCGKGDLMNVIWERTQSLHGVELNPEMTKYLKRKPYHSKIQYETDFLTLKQNANHSIDRIIMNPPFTKQQDIDHVRHAYDLLADGGILVSIMSIGWKWRSNRKSEEFKSWLPSIGLFMTDLDPGAFKESGTMIPTIVVKIIKR